MEKIKSKLLIILMLALVGCSNFFIPTQSFITQLKDNQKIGRDANYQKYALVDYPSNNLKRIKCIDKNGDNVWLYPDKNTEFEIKKKSDGKTITVYFDTAILQNDTLFGLRSRLIGGLRSIPINDIDRIEIYAEFPKTEPIE